ncbi:hypothetical protein [Lentzea indica]|nr:hypothetical protein [Lentzea indica]
MFAVFIAAEVTMVAVSVLVLVAFAVTDPTVAQWRWPDDRGAA